jgi:hypothetical protein
MVDWTKGKIAGLSTDEIETLRQNAAKRERQDIVEICKEELTNRMPVRTKKSSDDVSVGHRGQYVSEFHFVCPHELGITRNQDGTIWSGTWVVAKEHAEKAVMYGALVSLHSSKAEPSYLQGQIKDWRKSARQPRYSSEQLTQIEEGIDFLFKPSNLPLMWKGDGSGEKGYSWKPIPA